MGLFDAFKRVKDSINKNVNPEYSKNKDFLEAAAALSASIAMADGSIEDSEREAVVTLLVSHPVLGKTYSEADIKATCNTMFGRAATNSGKLQLRREIDDIKNKGQEMAQDVMMIGLDVAMADGELEPEEEKVLATYAARLGVDLKALTG